jgi:hypothetical protein
MDTAATDTVEIIGNRYKIVIRSKAESVSNV